MNIREWAKEVEAQLHEFEKVDLGYPKDKNGILPVTNPKLIEMLAQELKVAIPDQFQAFYRTYSRLDFPDIHNGYFISPLDRILPFRSKPLLPMKISYPDGREVNIIPFGSDGGGNFFALQLDGANHVLFLPVPGVENNVYFPFAPDEVRELSSDFYGFLDRLLADLKAAVRQDPNWMYMDWTYLDLGT